MNITIPFILRHRASLSCRGCDANSTLFQEATAAFSDFRQLTQFDGPVDKHVRRLQDHFLSCPTCTGPTSESFQAKYEAGLDLLVANSTITSIDYLGQMVQLENVTLTNFSADVFVDFIPANETASITDQEFRILEEGFRASYNALNSLNSDEGISVFSRSENKET